MLLPFQRMFRALQPGLMDVSRSVRYLDLADSKENKRAGSVGCTSVENPSKLLILCKLAERVGFENAP
jgi:hypothetical protein